MDDRELLELAAKAAGLDVIRCRLDDPMQQDMLVRKSSRNPYHQSGPWNPLTDDGDALRLAVKLGLNVDCGWGVNKTYVIHIAVTEDLYRCEEHGQDPCAATRRAIVRAAAEIGKNAVS